MNGDNGNKIVWIDDPHEVRELMMKEGAQVRWMAMFIKRSGDNVEISSVYLPTVVIPYQSGKENSSSPTWRRRWRERLCTECWNYLEKMVFFLQRWPDLRDSSYFDDFDDLFNTYHGSRYSCSDKPSPVGFPEEIAQIAAKKEKDQKRKEENKRIREELAAARKAMAGKPGNPTGANQHGGGISDIITNSSKDSRGTSLGYTLRRLKALRPDLHARVCAGEMTANAWGARRQALGKPLPQRKEFLKDVRSGARPQDLIGNWFALSVVHSAPRWLWSSLVTQLISKKL